MRNYKTILKFSLLKLFSVIFVAGLFTGQLSAQGSLQITSTPLPSGVVGVAYPPQTLTATGGTAPYVWSLQAGSLPPGLTMSSGGVIFGIPTTANTFFFIVGVTDSSTPQQTATNLFSIVIAPPSSAQNLQITTSSLSSGVVGVAYTPQTLTASGGTAPYVWSVQSGSLPPGLILSSGGTIFGLPTTANTFSFILSVTDSSTPTQTVTNLFSIVIAPAVSAQDLQITTSSLSSGVVGVAYTPQILTLTGGTAPYVWSVQSGSLPPGLTLSSGGVIFGIPTAGNTYFFILSVTDGSTPPQTAVKLLSIDISSHLAVTTATLPNGAAGTEYSPPPLTAVGGTLPYSWSILSGSLPAGLSLSSEGAISGTPTQSGTFIVNVGVTDASDPAQTASQRLSLTIQSQLTITTPSQLPNGAVGVFYGQQLAASGLPTVTWSLVSGILPPGLTLASSGSLSGTPAISGAFQFTAQAASSDLAQTARRAFFLSISPGLTITTSSLPSGTTRVPYTPQQLTATGGTGPYFWSVQAGSLPIGLTLSTAGVISGTPLTANTFSFTVSVTDSSGAALTVTKQFSITITAPVSITTTSLPNGAVGVTYVAPALAASAGTPPYLWSLAPGSFLPGGLVLSSEGVVSGTPFESGTFNIVVRATDSSVSELTASKTITLKIEPKLTITTDSQLPGGFAGVFYAESLAASGPSPVTWSLLSGIIPPGLTLSATGTISGTPTIASTFDFTVQAASSDPVQTDRHNFRLTVTAALTITTPVNLLDAALGLPYSVTLAATGGNPPLTWTAQSRLPTGLTLSSAGVLSGIPVGAGNLQFVVQVKDNFVPSQVAERTFSLSVVPPLAITTASLPSGFQNVPYSQQLQNVGGTPPLTWVVTSGTLPAGLTLTTDGLLQGIPPAVESQIVEITVADSRGGVNARMYTVVVDPPLPTLSAPALPRTSNPAQQLPLALSLSAPHPSALSGQLILSYTSKAEIPANDPMTQFSTGSRTVSFTIPANSTTAVFTSPVLVLAGTVAGTVSLMANINNGPSAIQVATVEILPLPPQVTSFEVISKVGGLDLLITGYSPARRVTVVEFGFDVKSGGKTRRVTLTSDVDAEFARWYQNAASVPFGSAFSFSQPVSISGSGTTVEAVTITLKNAQGNTSSAPVSPR